MKTEKYKPIVDALIFASDVPLSAQKIKSILETVDHEEISVKEIREIVEAINRDNRDNARGFYLQEVAGGYQFRTRPNYAEWVKKLKKSKSFRLTQSTLETLAIIAYQQPVIRAEVERIRGVECGGIIKNLLERNIIKIVGRKNIPGRPFLLGTTKRFLEVFGLERLSDLPSLKDIDDLDEARLPSVLRQKLPDELFEPDEEADDEMSTQAAAADSRDIQENGCDQESPADAELQRGVAMKPEPASGTLRDDDEESQEADAVKHHEAGSDESGGHA